MLSSTAQTNKIPFQPQPFRTPLNLLERAVFLLDKDRLPAHGPPKGSPFLYASC